METVCGVVVWCAVTIAAINIARFIGIKVASVSIEMVIWIVAWHPNKTSSVVWSITATTAITATLICCSGMARR